MGKVYVDRESFGLESYRADRSLQRAQHTQRTAGREDAHTLEPFLPPFAAALPLLGASVFATLERVVRPSVGSASAAAARF